MSPRVVRPELLDELAADVPEAMRGRRDLRRINFLMGNDRWILRALAGFPDAVSRGIVELGGGDGALAGKLSASFPDARLTVCDLAPRPAWLDARIEWKQADVLAAADSMAGGVLVANLFLHHFEGDALRELGKLCHRFEVLVFNEPDRSALPHALGFLMWPFVNRVTRHDMHVSIRGGFAAGELPRLLGLEAGNWKLRETSTWRGSRRMIGYRT